MALTAEYIWSDIKPFIFIGRSSLLKRLSILCTVLSVAFSCWNCSASNTFSSFFWYTVFSIIQKPFPLSKGTASNPFCFKYLLTFSTAPSLGVSRTFLAYHLAAASISHKCFPFMPSVFSCDNRLSTSARKCISLNYVLTVLDRRIRCL